MQIQWTKQFTREYQRLPAPLQKRVEQKLGYLATDIAYPSLRVKRWRRGGNLFEASVNMDYRMLFQITPDGYLMLRVGPHKILDKD
jgi:mRNA-degrading endonuclease RelE of RelBE toxin-antitoxin system